MPTTEKLAETDEGQADLKGNELVVTDKTGGDPVALGGVSANGGICKWNFKAKRPDGSIVEIGYLYGKQDERYPGQHVGEAEIWVKAPGQGAADTKVIGFRHDGVVFYRGAGVAGSDRLVSADGRFVTIPQTGETNSAGAAPGIVVVQNWTEELKKITPGK